MIFLLQRIKIARALAKTKVTFFTLVIFQMVLPLQRLLFKREYFPVRVTVALSNNKAFRCVISDLSDLAVLKDIILEKEYESPFLIAPKTIVDIGCNTGLSTIYFHTMYPQASIVGFEPNPFIQKVLYKNCKQIPMLQLYQSAVGGISGQATFYIHTKSTKSSSFEMRDKKAQAVTVSVVTLDDILPGESIDLLKLDVEGAEFSILENGALSRINSIIAEIHEDIANRSVKELQEICERTHEVKLRSIGKGRYMLYARKK